MVLLFPGYHYQQQSQPLPLLELQPTAPNSMSASAESGATRGGGGGGAPQRMSRWKIPDKLVPITVDSLKTRLQNRLDELKETHHSHTQRLERLESDMETAEKEVDEVEERSKSNSVDYQFTSKCGAIYETSSPASQKRYIPATVFEAYRPNKPRA